MNVYKIAGMTFTVESPIESYKKICKEYALTDVYSGEIDFSINITEDDIEKEEKLYSYPCTKDMANSSRIYRAICFEAIKRGGFFVHCAAIEYGGLAYAFLAPSGTGKSTHIKLWKKLLGDKVSIINGDKPLIMPDKNGRFSAYGTPWSGKEGWQRNVAVQMGAICILRRGAENKIKEISSFEALQYLLKQTLIPNTQNEVEKLLENADRFLCSGVRTYMLECNMDIEAAKTAFEKMTERSI